MAVAVSTATQKLTFEQWRSLPETKQRYEIVDGVASTPVSCSLEHQWVLQNILFRGMKFDHETDRGELTMAPLDLLIGRDPLCVRQPDIMFLNSRRAASLGVPDFREFYFVEIPPDITMEVLSQPIGDYPLWVNTRHDMEAKLWDYQRIGVYQCWILDSKDQTAELIDLTGDEPKTASVLGVEETLVSQLLPGFELDCGKSSGRSGIVFR